MKPKTYHLLERCVSDGIEAGFSRARKHNENPPEEKIKEQLLHEIMLEVCEWFEFDAEREDE